jgi:hypothetical protein
MQEGDGAYGILVGNSEDDITTDFKETVGRRQSNK